MPEPLNYRNPKARDSSHREQSAPAKPRQAVPIEFDVVLTRTEDHAAARAIESELKRLEIAYFRSEEPGLKDRTVELYVRTIDRNNATEIASRIFARRKKLKSYPKVDPLPDMPDRSNGIEPFF